MKVEELRRQISSLPADMPVIIAGDAEGNWYSPLADTSREYATDGPVTWEVELSEDDEGTPVVVLWPVN